MNLIVYDKTVNLLREFFRSRGYIEVQVQHKLSILAACEDPETISIFNFSGVDWPLAQTGQMHLEHILLQNPKIEGVYCVTTSHRNEPNPVPGRHDLIFPMVEFEGRGSFYELGQVLYGILEKLEIIEKKDKYSDLIKQIDLWRYKHLAEKFGVSELTFEHEARLDDVAAIQFFPESANPFWNMKKNKSGTYNKADIILGGIETIGSAEREVDTNAMRERFFNISAGKYSQLLFNHFTEERVMKELNEYLALPMTERFGGGIGMTRLIRYLEKK